jgi:primosomal protein N' (replication factor Y)
MKIAEVVVAKSLQATDKIFHYLVPNGMDASLGSRVIVPFGLGNKTTEGFVVGFAQSSPYENLKEITKVVDVRPLLTETTISLAKWMKERYLCTFYQAIKTIVPSGISIKTTQWLTLIDSNPKITAASQKAVVELLKEAGTTVDFGSVSHIKNAKAAVSALHKKGIISLDETIAQNVSRKIIRMVEICSDADISALYKKAPRQAKMLETLSQTGEISAADLVAFSGGSYASLGALHQKGYIRFSDKVVYRTAYNEENFKKTLPLPPTNEQKKVLQHLKDAISAGDVSPALLRGVTGSGKTEVFLQIIQYVLEMGKQAIVLVPEISLTPQMVERFVGRFGSKVSVLHSGLSLGERYDEWIKIRTGKVSVAVGARSAIFAPFENLGIIIIDEEHEGTYKSENTPFYHAREVALKRSEIENALVLLSSATPSICSYYKAKQGEYKLFEMLNRHNNSKMPYVSIVDMRDELARGNRSVFSESLQREIEKNIKAEQQTILFHNRRGFNSFVMCRSCGETLTCNHCSISLTYHKNSDRLKCHYCGFERYNVTSCPSCKSPYIRYMGTGTEKIEEEIKRLYGEKSFIRMDGDTTAGKNSHEIILKRFERENIPILLGTQMVTKGLDFPNVTLVGVIMADLSLNIDDFRSAERTFGQLTQVCGRAGRGEISGRAIIQTYQPDHYAIRLAREHDFSEFYRQEISLREQLSFPPFCDIVVILMQGEDINSIKSELYEIAKKLKGKCDTLLGPVSAPYAKIKNKYRWRILLKCKNLQHVMPVLKEIMQNREKSKNQLTIDINPNSMN